MVGRRVKYRRIVELWLTVEFYNIAFLILDAVILKNGVTEESLLTLLPVLSDQFWYFSSYFCLFFFIPFFNKLIDGLSKKALCGLLLTGFLLFSLPTVITAFDTLHLNYGYSTWWLMYLYFVGAAIKKHGLFSRLPAYGALLGYLAAVGVTYVFKCFTLLFKVADFGIVETVITRFGLALDNYSSPTVLAAGMFLLLFCIKLTFPPRLAAGMSRLQPFVFQIYIIHLHHTMWTTVFKNGFSHYAEKSPLLLALYTLGTALVIFVGCLLIDVLRHWLFKLLHVKPLVDTVADRLAAGFNRSTLKKRLDTRLEPGSDNE